MLKFMPRAGAKTCKDGGDRGHHGTLHGVLRVPERERGEREERGERRATKKYPGRVDDRGAV